MAVQIARAECNRLHFDYKVFGNILDKVGVDPVAVIAVSGPLHNGKSSIVNRLLHVLSTQDVGDEDSSHQIEMAEIIWKTSADQHDEILMWPEPFKINHNGRNIAVLLMTVHGNLDDTIPSLDNALILAFGCLLASVMIYHVQNGISENMLQFLQMVISSSKAANLKDNRCSFAKLLFVINDWQLPGDYSYGFHEDQSRTSMRNYKKEMLDVLTGVLPERRVVRQEILTSCREICCCLMPHFGDETVEGIGQIQDLTNWILREGSSINKTLEEKEVTGIELKGRVQDWARSLAISKILPFRMDIEAADLASNAMALSVALKFFKTEMTNAINGPKRMTHEQLGEFLDQKKKEAVAMFERMTIPQHDEVVMKKYVSILEDEFNVLCGPFLKKPPLPEAGMVQMDHPTFLGSLCPDKGSDHLWRHMCIFVIALHIVVVAIVIFSLVYRHFNADFYE